MTVACEDTHGLCRTDYEIKQHCPCGVCCGPGKAGWGRLPNHRSRQLLGRDIRAPKERTGWPRALSEQR